MSLHELELTVGDVVQIGEYTVTVMDMDDEEVTFRIQEPASDEEPNETSAAARPR